MELRGSSAERTTKVRPALLPVTEIIRRQNFDRRHSFCFKNIRRRYEAFRLPVPSQRGHDSVSLVATDKQDRVSTEQRSARSITSHTVIQRMTRCVSIAQSGDFTFPNLTCTL